MRPGAVGGAAAGSGGVYDGPSPPCAPPCVPSRAALLREKALTSCCFHDAPRASCGAPPGGPSPGGPAGRVAASGLSGARGVKSAASIARRDSVSETESEGSRETSISPVRPVEVPLLALVDRLDAKL